MKKLTPTALKGLLKKTGRHSDGQGLYFRAVGDAKAYWVYRFRINGREREMSLGPYPEMTLAEARAKHAALRKTVITDGVDPLAPKNKRAPKTSTGVPTFGAMADQHVETHEGAWRNAKHRRQWRTTLTQYCGLIRPMPVDEVGTDDVLAVLKPIWNTIPESASRLRGRIETVIDAARALGHIDANRANPARWKGHLDKLLPKPKKLSRGHHKALPYADLPELMARLGEIDTTASRALRFTILTASRTSEVLKMTFVEIDFDKAVWTIPASRMKMARQHEVPLSDQAVAILRAQEAERGRNPHVFAGQRPRQPLSHMSMAMILRRRGVGVTVHGMRSSARSWMADTGVPFELAEACLAHQVGNAVVQAYQRSSMLERRRPIMSAWSAFVTGTDADNVVPIKRGAA